MVNRSEKDSTFRSKAIVIVVAAVVSLAGIVFDRILLHEGIPRYDLLAISNSLTGIVASAFFWQSRRRDRERRDFLQVISFYSSRDQDEKTMELLRQAVGRIEWALNDVLPGELGGSYVPDLSREHSGSREIKQ